MTHIYIYMYIYNLHTYIHSNFSVLKPRISFLEKLVACFSRPVLLEYICAKFNNFSLVVFYIYIKY